MKDPNWRKCVINGDSRDILKYIPDNSIDFILTDPPYNLGQHSTGNIPLPGRTAMNNDVADWDMIDFNPEEWVDELIRVLKPTGNLFIFTSYNQIGRWYNCLDHRFDTTNFMIWHKTNPAPKIFKAGFLNSCEMIFTCWNKKHTWNFISQAEMHNFLESPICMGPERLKNPKHPAQKPVSILKKIIRIASNENDIILDPFMGVGSTGVSALELNRRFIGVEIEKSYFVAAKNRIEEALEKIHLATSVERYDISLFSTNYLCEPMTEYNTIKKDINAFFSVAEMTGDEDFRTFTGLSPIIKWPGGKEKELKYIIPNLPNFDRFFEPFVGGGSVFMGINSKEYFINDFSDELIGLYNCISSLNTDFFKYAREIDESWTKALKFFTSNFTLVDMYIDYRIDKIDEARLKKNIEDFCVTHSDEINDILGNSFKGLSNNFSKELKINLFRKMKRMKVLEFEKHELPYKDLQDNIECAIKSALYMNYRVLYNDTEISKCNDIMHCALFFFIRNYAYSGMFRYSANGDFNVPYGGIAYNGKQMGKKLDYYLSPSVVDHFSKTHIFGLDFEDFLKTTQPSENDFIFLDPPYDSEFSTYAKNDFTKEDQERLAKFLTSECRAKWMMIIKNTDFIYNLYNKEGIQIRTFDKEYLVSFMNRNNKKVTHLLITNY